MSDLWDRRFLELAKHISEWSKDPSTKVGAVIVDNKRCILGLGYNGFPRGVEDTRERLNDRPIKYQYIVHAEVNAILNSNGNVSGSTLYIYPLFACSECAKVVIQSGISKVITPRVENSRWMESNNIAKIMMTEAGIKIETYDF